MSVLIRAEQLRVSFPARSGRRTEHAVTIGPVDLTVSAGDLVLLRGASLTGRSVILGTLAGLHEPTQGSVLTMTASWSLVPQRISLIEGLTIEENVLLAGRLALAPPPDEAWADHVIECLSLTDLRGRTPTEVSYGEQHRIMLARSLCAQPSVLLVDEPFAHQDPEMCVEIVALIRRYIAEPSRCCVVACRRDDAELWGGAARVVSLSRPAQHENADAVRVETWRGRARRS